MPFVKTKSKYITLSNIVAIISIIGFITVLIGWVYTSGQNSRDKTILENRVNVLEGQVSLLSNKLNEQNQYLGEISGKFTILLNFLDVPSKPGKPK